MRVTNFTHVDFTQGLSVVNVVADIADADVGIDQGNAQAGVEACKIHPKVSGSAATHAHVQKAQLTAFGGGRFDPVNKCFKLYFTNATVKLDQVQIHDTSLHINVGPIPGMNVGKLVDLVVGLAPVITTTIDNAIEGPISSAVTNAASS